MKLAVITYKAYLMNPEKGLQPVDPYRMDDAEDGEVLSQLYQCGRCKAVADDD
jgi:hypothetical protein